MHIVYFFWAEYFCGQNISDEETGKASKRGRNAGAMADKCAFAGTQTAATATEYE